MQLAAHVDNGPATAGDVTGTHNALQKTFEDADKNWQRWTP